MWDRRFRRILYLTQYKSARQPEEFAPASDFGLSDEQLQARILRKGWTVAFIGGVDGPGYMVVDDREEDDVVLVPDVVEEVERGDVFHDGQDQRGADIDDNVGAGVEIVASTSAPGRGWLVLIKRGVTFHWMPTLSGPASTTMLWKPPMLAHLARASSAPTRRSSAACSTAPRAAL